MEVRVLFFAQLRELFGASEKILEMSEGETVGQVVELLVEGSKNSGVFWSAIKYAVNEEFSDLSRELKDQDTLVLIPPVSGG